DDLEGVRATAPAARDGLDGLRAHGLVLDLVLAGEVEVPVLGGAPGAGDVEAGQVAAAGAAPPLAVGGDAEVGGRVSHGCSSVRGCAGPVRPGAGQRSARALPAIVGSHV